VQRIRAPSATAGVGVGALFFQDFTTTTRGTLGFRV